MTVRAVPLGDLYSVLDFSVFPWVIFGDHRGCWYLCLSGLILSWHFQGSFPVGYNIVIFVFLIWRGVCSSLDITGFFFQGIEFVQVLVLLCAAGMQITATVRILIVGWAYHVVVDLVVGDLLVDIETIRPLMAVEEDVAAGFQIEDLTGLDLVLDHSEMMGYLEIILMYVQEKEIGCALIPRKFTIFIPVVLIC